MQEEIAKLASADGFLKEAQREAAKGNNLFLVTTDEAILRDANHQPVCKLLGPEVYPAGSASGSSSSASNSARKMDETTAQA